MTQPKSPGNEDAVKTVKAGKQFDFSELGTYMCLSLCLSLCGCACRMKQRLTLASHNQRLLLRLFIRDWTSTSLVWRVPKQKAMEARHDGWGGLLASMKMQSKQSKLASKSTSQSFQHLQAFHPSQWVGLHYPPGRLPAEYLQ